MEVMDQIQDYIVINNDDNQAPSVQYFQLLCSGATLYLLSCLVADHELVVVEVEL